MNMKFTFHLKNGKTFECVEKQTAEELQKTIEVIKLSMRDGINAYVSFDNCCVRIAECAVVEWEELS